MPHYALLCPAAAGHILPVGALGNELARRGHQVTMVGPFASSGLAKQLNVDHYELKTDQVRYPFDWPKWAVFSLFGAGWKIALRDAFRWRAEYILQLMPQALRELNCDGLIVDQTLTAGGTVAELLGLPYVTICTSVPWNEDQSVPPAFTRWPHDPGHAAMLRNRIGYAAWHWYIGPFLHTVNGYREKWKLPLLPNVDASYSSLAQISQLCAELDFPQPQLPKVFHYVGPLGAQRQESDENFDWDRLDGRPLIFASLGTEPYRSNLRVYQRILRACEDLDAQLVLALGKWRDQEKTVRDQLGQVPENAIVVDFAPQLALLNRASLMITHSGVNSAMEAVSRAVPLLAMPRAEDQPGMAARVEYAGVGLRASFHHSSSEQLRGLIKRVLTEDAFRRRAKQLQAAIVQAGGVQRAADITERVLSTGQPALSSDCY